MPWEPPGLPTAPKSARSRHSLVTASLVPSRVLGRAITFALVGLEPRRVEVEAHLRTGSSRRSRSSGSQTARARRRSTACAAACTRRCFEWPEQVITVNLAPAALRKEGTGFDLAIALTVLAASGQVPPARLAEHACIGELGLDGASPSASAGRSRRPRVRRAQDSTRLLCAADSAHEAALAGIEAVGVRHIAEAVGYLRGEDEIAPAPRGSDPRSPPNLPDLADVRGQERGRRALELAARARTTSSSRARRGRGRRCSGGASRRSSRR